MPTLLDAARRSGLAFEASPSGRWVKFYTAGTQIYVVEGAWGNSFIVWAGEQPAPTGTLHYLYPDQALAAVRKLAS